jgi:dephospho-CoA kinase
VRQQRILSVYEEEAFEGIVIWDAALLIESSGAKGMDRVVVVITDQDTELTRLMARDGFPEEDARRRIGSQMPLAEKVKVADYVIDNSGPRSETERLVKDVYRALTRDLAAALAARS